MDKRSGVKVTSVAVFSCFHNHIMWSQLSAWHIYWQLRIVSSFNGKSELKKKKKKQTCKWPTCTHPVGKVCTGSCTLATSVGQVYSSYTRILQHSQPEILLLHLSCHASLFGCTLQRNSLDFGFRVGSCHDANAPLCDVSFNFWFGLFLSVLSINETHIPSHSVSIVQSVIPNHSVFLRSNHRSSGTRPDFSTTSTHTEHCPEDHLQFVFKPVEGVAVPLDAAHKGAISCSLRPAELKCSIQWADLLGIQGKSNVEEKALTSIFDGCLHHWEPKWVTLTHHQILQSGVSVGPNCLVSITSLFVCFFYSYPLSTLLNAGFSLPFPPDSPCHSASESESLRMCNPRLVTIHTCGTVWALVRCSVMTLSNQTALSGRQQQADRVAQSNSSPCARVCNKSSSQALSVTQEETGLLSVSSSPSCHMQQRRLVHQSKPSRSDGWQEI